MDERVVVGVNDSRASVAALAWAIPVCRKNGWQLEIVAAWPDRGSPMVHEVPGHVCAPRARAVASLNEALRRTGVVLDDSHVSVHVDNRDPVHALVSRAQGARLLVLGATRLTHPRSGFAPMSQVCRPHVSCPVVIIDEGDVPQARTA